MAVTYQSSITAFLDSLQYEKRYSPNTVSSYRNDLMQFFDFLEIQFDHPALTDISSAMARTWMASLKDAGIGAKSINRKLSALKSFFKYQMKTGIISRTPISNITAPKMGRKLPVYVEKSDIATLLTYVEFPSDHKGRTDRLIIEILYNTGMRVSELVNLRESYLDTANKTLKVLGKGNKERILPLSIKLAESIREYVSAKRQEIPVADTVHLLVNKNGQLLNRAYAAQVVKRYLGYVTTIEKKSPHVLRHSFATHLMNNGADLNSVKELLGHASLAATQVYTHNTIEKLKDIHQKSHPKA